MDNKTENTEKNNNQFKGKNGGYRPGSGRKPKVGNVGKDLDAREMYKRAFDKCVKEEDYINIIDTAKSDPKLFPYYLDQRIGKASQSVNAKLEGELKINIVDKFE